MTMVRPSLNNSLLLSIGIILFILPSLVVAEESLFNNVVIFVIDAVPAEKMLWAFEANESRLLNNSVYFANTTTIFPGSSPAAHSSIFTGRYPSGHSINGIKWVDKSSEKFINHGIEASWENVQTPFLNTNNYIQNYTLYNRSGESGFTSEIFGEFIRKDASYTNPAGDVAVGLTLLGGRGESQTSIRYGEV